MNNAKSSSKVLYSQFVNNNNSNKTFTLNCRIKILAELELDEKLELKLKRCYTNLLFIALNCIEMKKICIKIMYSLQKRIKLIKR